MKIQRFNVSNKPHLKITCHSDLDISGGREGEVAIKVYGQEEDLQVEREGERLTILTHTRCKIGCPQGTSITAEAVHGSLRVRRVDGPLAVDQINGDTLLKEVGPTTITTAGGDVRARSVRGALQVETVNGDLAVRGVEGPLSSKTIGGDLNASYLEGGMNVTAGGDAVLTTDFTTGCDYLLQTGGDAVLKFPHHASANLKITAGGHIHHKVEWAELHPDDHTLSGRVGDGEAEVEINVGGDVSLRSKSDAGAFVFTFAPDEGIDIELESMAEEIERNIEIHMARMNAQLEAQLGRIDHEAIRRKAERAAEKVRRKAEQAAERARLRAERAQRRWERMGAQRTARPGPRAPSPPRPPEPVSEEERVMILRMVEEGKITASEAAQLLEALEG